MSGASLDAVDAELARWRGRLAAASRNVSELSELPEFAVARQAAAGSGRLAEEARSLAATVDELWQGVLLIGACLDRAEGARRAGSRLWRATEAAQEALVVLRDASITIDLADTPVLHRRLLAGPRATVTVTPDALLQTMDAAFDRARDQLGRMADASARAAGLRARLAAAIARLPVPDALAARLTAADLPDPLDALDALDALAPAVDAAVAAADAARQGLDAARNTLAALQADAAAAAVAAQSCRAVVMARLPTLDSAAVPELAAWLDRIARTLEAGRVEACSVGLANWRAQQAHAAAAVGALAATASAALARRDELRARLGALRAKHRARPDPALDAPAAAARAALAAEPTDLDAAARALAAYEAALAR